MKLPFPAPVEAKVATGSAVALVTGVVTWILVTYVPAFHRGLPGPLASFLPQIVAVVLGAVSAYAAPHTPRPDAPAGPQIPPYVPGGKVTP